ncbi:Transcriptional regulator, LysR family [Pseudomonas chlororaphis subsp. aurantiaca]|nr:Transcriptional regulator, LysR family [Pseudomonas chlororaphis subsp. aurantiaca]
MPARGAGHPDYFARHGEPACPTDLGQHQAIIYSLGGGAHWRFERGTNSSR